MTAFVSGKGEHASAETIAVPVDGGEPRLICAFACNGGWSPDGRFFFAVIESGATLWDAGKTVVIPVPSGSVFPDLPSDGLPSRTLPSLPGARMVERVNLSPAPGFGSYVYSKTDIQRNLYRIPLH